MKFLIFFIIFFCTQVLSRETGQIEITTDEGIEVFNEEKYYLLKKNVLIISDDFELSADLVKAYFDKDLYDIKKIHSEGNVDLKSNNGIIASGQKINIDIKNEDLLILGKNSLLINNQIKMMSDGKIKVNNLTGEFSIIGINSKLQNNDTNVIGSFIEGKFAKSTNKNGFENLYVKDDKQINIKTKTLDMYALIADYDKKNNTIELFDNVRILRDNEIISGDYAKINIESESYKVTSKKSEKVKVLLNNVNE